MPAPPSQRCRWRYTDSKKHWKVALAEMVEIPKKLKLAAI